MNATNSLRYSDVNSREIGNGFKKYFFSDRISNPDSLTSKVFHRINSCSGNSGIWREKNRIYLSKSNERGKLIREEFFDENNTKIKETILNYSNFLQKLPTIHETGYSDSKVSDLNYYVRTIEYGSFTCHVQTIYVPVLPYLLTSQTSTEYFNNSKIETNKSISYNNNYFLSSTGFRWHPYRTEESVLTPTGKNTKKYLYSYDLQKIKPRGCTRGCDNVDDDNFFGSQYATYDRMNNLNIISTPVITINKTNSNYSLNENLFHNNPTIYGRKIRQSSLDTILDFVNFKNPSTNSSILIMYDKYDNRGNLTQETTKDGVPSTTIWGYHQTIPIATIKGATYSDIMQVFGLNFNDSSSYLQLDIVKKSNGDIDDASENLLIKDLDAFRTTLSAFEVFTYTYDPLIGVTSITPPSGIREIYKYDSSNRLQSVVDVNSNILKEYKYNYKP